MAVRYNSKTGNWHWVVAKRNKTTLKIYDPQKESPIEERKKKKNPMVELIGENGI